MKTIAPCVAFALTLASIQAQSSVQISIGVRETGFAGSLVGNIGGNGGTVGGIEWINRDGQTLPLDGQWHNFSFDFATDPILGFAGTSANSILEGSYGVLEHLRVLNSGGITDPIVLLIDDVVNTTTTLGPTVVTDFEFQTQGAEWMFRHASFSGSTSANLVTAMSTAGIENDFPAGTSTYRLGLQFIGPGPLLWARITTFNSGGVPNPVVRFDDNSVVTFRMMAFTVQQPDLGLQGPGTATAALVGDGLNTGQASTFHAAFAPPATFGAVTVSLFGLPDLPIQGGTVASGTGFLFVIPVFTDAAGHASVTITGDPTVMSFALQSVFFDPSLPLSIAFSNAVQAPFGQ